MTLEEVAERTFWLESKLVRIRRGQVEPSDSGLIDDCYKELAASYRSALAELDRWRKAVEQVRDDLRHVNTVDYRGRCFACVEILELMSKPQPTEQNQ